MIKNCINQSMVNDNYLKKNDSADKRKRSYEIDS